MKRSRGETLLKWAIFALAVSMLVLMFACVFFGKAKGAEPANPIVGKFPPMGLSDQGYYPLAAALPKCCCERFEPAQKAKEDVPTLATPSLEDRETTWTKFLAAKYGWRDDVVAWDGSRPDLVLDCYAIEVDWAKQKWKEAIGQSFDYAATTWRKPAVLLLVKDFQSEEVDLYRAERSCQRAGVLLLIYDCKKLEWRMPAGIGDGNPLPTRSVLVPYCTTPN